MVLCHFGINTIASAGDSTCARYLRSSEYEAYLSHYQQWMEVSLTSDGLPRYAVFQSDLNGKWGALFVEEAVFDKRSYRILVGKFETFERRTHGVYYCVRAQKELEVAESATSEIECIDSRRVRNVRLFLKGH